MNAADDTCNQYFDLVTASDMPAGDQRALAVGLARDLDASWAVMSTCDSLSDNRAIEVRCKREVQLRMCASAAAYRRQNPDVAVQWLLQDIELLPLSNATTSDLRRLLFRCVR